MLTRQASVAVLVACVLLGIFVVQDYVAADQAKSKPHAPHLGKRTITDLGMELMPVAAGSFEMGYLGRHNPNPSVQISCDYWVGTTEVTQEQWVAITGNSANNPSYFKGNKLPVEQVSWDDAVSFCEKLTELERVAGRLPKGYVYRLPTEAEWEYAARGGAISQGQHYGVTTEELRYGTDFGEYNYSGSSDIDDVAWYNNCNSDAPTHPVGQKKPNQLRLFDMSGNVWEWCYDWFVQDISTDDIRVDPSGPRQGSCRAYRGGSWISSGGRSCFVTTRCGYSPSTKLPYIGFRVVLAPYIK